MSPEPLQRPKRPTPPVTRPKNNQPQSKKAQPPRRDGGSKKPPGGKNRSGGNNGGGNSSPESPWIMGNPNPHTSASFVEYLRWMRSLGGNYDDDTKVQIMQLAKSKADYRKRLDTLTERTKLIAGKENCFEVVCPWRIRVGGHRGPESILLPAFDATGMPYIPSSTLRGVARTQAIREKMREKNISWEDAEQFIASYFGSLEDENTNNRMGKVTFLDAYPLTSKTGGLEMDIATSIWNWNDNSIEYKEPNPNVFFSLKEAKFLIGLRLSSNCQDTKFLNDVRKWLIKGLSQGVGSQVNTGYGELRESSTRKNKEREFFRMRFNIEGQLIHGHKEFNDVNQPYLKDRDRGNYKTDRKGNLKPSSKAIPEVRPTAFKSTLRYWFRAFSLGVLQPNIVREWEGKLFGAIEPSPSLGWVKVNIEAGKLVQKEPKRERDPAGEQEGIITLSYGINLPSDRNSSIASLCQTLMWLMFNLGGVGQGSRRPCYSRQNRQPRAFPPYHRGCTFYLDADLETPNSYWYAPESTKQFQKILKRRIREFHSVLEAIIPNINLEKKIESPLSFGTPTTSKWYEAIDFNARIIVCSGRERNQKSYALATLHDRQFKNGDRYDGNLCGETGKPSPVWVADLGDYQVVTVFGANKSPRSDFLELLEEKADEYYQVFPF